MNPVSRISALSAASPSRQALVSSVAAQPRVSPMVIASRDSQFLRFLSGVFVGGPTKE